MTRYTELLVIEPRKSMQLLVVLLSSHLISGIVVVMLLQHYGVIQFVVLLLIGFSWFYYYHLHIAKVLSRSVLVACHHQDKGWLIQTVSEKQKHKIEEDVTEVILMGSSYVSSWWIVLNFQNTVSNDNRQGRCYYTLLVPMDSVSSEVYHQLRVRLKIMG